MANLKFINIKDVDYFVSEVKKLHVHRQFSPECNNVELAYNKKVFQKDIEPTQDFFHLLELVQNSDQSTNFTKNRSKVMRLIIKLLPERGTYQIRGYPLVFSSFSRTISWTLSDEMDLFVQILILQLLTANYFKLKSNLDKLPTLLKNKNIVSIMGRHAYNPRYHNKVLLDINEGVLKELNLEHERLKITREYLRNTIFKENNRICSNERWYALGQRRYLTGFKLHLGENYFDEGLEPLKSYNEKCYKICVGREWESCSWKHFKRRTPTWYYHEQIKRWQKTKLGHVNLHKLHKRTILLNYGIPFCWTTEENRWSLVEDFLKFSPFISTKTLSPYFCYLYFWKPKNQYIIPTHLNPLPMLYKVLKDLNEKNNVLVSAEQLVRERAKNSTHSYFRNITLSLLKKHLYDFTLLTSNDKKLKLKLYELIQDGEPLPLSERAPLIFPVEREFESNHNRFKSLKYKGVSIIFDWKEFSVLLKGRRQDLKLIFLIGALYWDFSKNKIKLTSPVVHGWKPRKFYQILIKNFANNTNLLSTRSVFKNFDKDLLTVLLNIKWEEDLEIELQFKPSTFVHLIKTTLTTNTRDTVIRENSEPNPRAYEELWAFWGSGAGCEFGYQESWRISKD